MTWQKRIVTDQNVEYPNRFKIDGVSHTIEPDFGTVVEPGTPINKEYLQPIEDYLEIVATKDEIDSHKVEKANLSVLGHVNHAVLTATLNTAWLGTSAPYTKTVSVSGILYTDTPIIDVVMSGTYSTDEARTEAWGYIYRAVCNNGSITFYATEKPTVSLPIQIRVVR